jgi:Flp pilus assembly protein TadB
LKLLQRIAGAILGVVLLVFALVFASVILAVAGVVALVAGAWLWWFTRDARRAARMRAGGQPRPERPQGTVIEGEYRVEREVRRLEDGER